MVYQQFGGINGICFYVSEIFVSAGFNANLGITIYAILQIIVTALGASLIDRAGRRALLLNLVELDGLRKAHVWDGAAVVQYLVWLDNQVSNHVASVDDPFVIASLVPPNVMLDARNLRWTLCATDRCFKNPVTSAFFRSVKVLPVSRGDGIYQNGMDMALSKLNNGGWIHIFPEGSRSRDGCRTMGSAKRGVGRLVMDADKIPIVLPFVHTGMQDIMPIGANFPRIGQMYQDGRTDITRTVHFGKPSAHEKACYTAVLKGHIALDTARFPNGTNGHALDILARVPLWKDGLDYRHGTGHGIGSFLNVHEGPHLISFRPQARNVPIQASMTVTDEPGYYEDGNFGIRLENVLIVNEAKTKFNFGDKGYLSFEHITWTPYQTKLMNLSLLAPEEIQWVNEYHSKCREVLGQYLDESEMAWLKKATEPISVA